MARSTFWNDTISEIAIGSGNLGSIDLTADVPTTELRGTTLIRLIYKVLVYPANFLEAETIQGLHMGVALLENDAFAAGGASIPDPGVQLDAPGRGWVVRDQTLTASYLGDAGNLVIGEMKGDIRAMRKIYQNASLAMLFRSDVEVGTPQTLNVFTLVRCLMKQQ